jgi:hypothetical protein
MPASRLFHDLPAAAFAPSSRRATAMVVALLIAAATGCGSDDAERRKAYDDAQAVVARERATLAAMQAEHDRLYGEYQMHDFESRLWSGRVSIGKLLGFDLDRRVGRDRKLTRFFYQKWPLGWLGRMDRLLTQRSDLLPWYNKYQGEMYQRKLTDHYKRMLGDLNDRLAIQRDRVRNAEEYARIIAPKDVKQ